MAVSKQARMRAVAAGAVIATAMIAGTFSVPVRAADAPSPTFETSSSSDGLTPCPLLLIAGLLVISLASFVQNGVKIKLF